MNKRYRKVMRLKSRHYRQGHTSFCRCWEPRQSGLLALKRYLDAGGQIPRRRVQRVRKPFEAHTQGLD